MKHAVWLALLVACADTSAPPAPVSTVEQDATVCGVGPTVKGIDVSFYQGSIDWNTVAGAGVKYAMIRVSDGTGYIDPNFETYWAGSRAAGVYHGAYQFFEPGEDPIAQADLLLSKIGGAIAPDDLPPMLDVEVTGGLGPSAVAAAVKQWVDYVTGKLGRPPIIYTGYYFWRDSVGGADETASPLWHAQYSSASCPTIADPWTSWAFWQYTSTGSIAGIAGNVDTDRWNGDLTALEAFLGPPGTCGDGTCNAGESQISCPEDCGPCGTIDAAGGEIDNGDACYQAGGPQAYIRHVSDAGENGNLDWTHTTSAASEANFAEWDLYFAQAGSYQIEVYTAAAYAQSTQAKYVIVGAGQQESDVTLDQTAADGWQSLGTFQFDQGGHQYVHLGDNTGEPEANNVQLVFDAVRITPVDSGGGGSDSGSGSGSGGETDPAGGHGGGCAAGGGSGGLLIALALLGLRRRDR